MSWSSSIPLSGPVGASTRAYVHLLGGTSHMEAPCVLQVEIPATKAWPQASRRGSGVEPGQSAHCRYSAVMPTSASSGGPRDHDRAPASHPRRGEQSPSRIRTAAAALLGLEALIVAAVATYSFVGVASAAIDGRFGAGLGIFLLGFALAVGLAARSILSRGRFGLGFGITWQLFQALVGATMLRSGLIWQGAVALALAIVAFVLLTKLVTSTPLPGRED